MKREVSISHKIQKWEKQQSSIFLKKQKWEKQQFYINQKNIEREGNQRGMVYGYIGLLD